MRHKGFKHTEEAKKKMSLASKGKAKSVAHRKALSIAKLGRPGPWTGKKRPDITGSNNWKWIADRTKLAKRQERNDSAYKEWRKSVRDRDGWSCKMSNGHCLGKVVAHHILPWARFPELRYDTNNGITLCNFHHPRKREDEARLSPYFQSLLVNEH